MECPTMNPQHCAVLDSLFTNTVSLRLYICQHRDCRVGITEQLKNASTRLQELLDTALATHTPSIQTGKNIECSSDDRFTYQDNWSSSSNNSVSKQEELIHETIHDLLSSSDTVQSKRTHLLSRGYRIIKNGGQSTLSGYQGAILPIEQAYSNTLVSELKRPHWRELFQIIGPVLMKHLIRYTCIFIPLRNNSYYQLTGNAIHNLDIKAQEISVQHYVPAFVNDIILPNLRMPCCETTIQKDSSQLLVQKKKSGKKRKLSRCHKSTVKPNSVNASTDNIVTDIEEENKYTSHGRPCRRERKRQRILAMMDHADNHAIKNDSDDMTVVPSKIATTASKRKNGDAEISYNKETIDIKPAKRKRGISSRSVSSLLLKRSLMFYGEPRPDRQNQIPMSLPGNYMLTLPVMAQQPSTSSNASKHVISSAALDALLIDIFPKQYRRPNILQGTAAEPNTLQKKNPFSEKQPYRRKWRLPHRLHQFKKYFASICRRHSQLNYKTIVNQFCSTKHHGTGADQFSSHAQVCAFVTHCLKEVFPRRVWGSQENFQNISKVVHTYISLRKHETLSLTQLMQAFKIKDCNYLSKVTSTSISSSHQPPSEMLKREEIMREFLFWLFQYYITPLLSATFFVTDNSQYRNRIFYFRKDVWQAISKPALRRLISDNFTALEASKFEYSCLRLLPKGANIRPITNMKRRLQVGMNGSKITLTSANTVLANALRALTYEKEENPGLLGSSIMSFDEFYKSLSHYKEWYLSKGKTSSERPNLYFAKVDIKGCFDSIEQDVLLKILDKLLSQDEYIIKRYSTAFTTTGGKIHFRHKKYAQSADEYDSFQEYALKMADTLPNTIFVDNVLYSFEDRDDLLELIRKHIKCNVVKIGKGFYRQTLGIPQGSCLSTILCSYFYGSMENEELAFLKDDKDALLMRFVDDFICISPNKTTVQKFTTTMHKGSVKYGCFVSHAKSLVNFDMMYNGNPVTKLENTFEFPWCGFLIDTRDLEVYSNYQQYLTCHLQDTLTTEFNRHPGQTLVHKGMLAIKPKLRPVYVNRRFNRSDTIARNIFEAFLMCAFKLCSSASIMKYSGAAYINENFILKAIWHIVLTTTHLVKAKLHSLSVIWLGLHAFRLALKRKSRLAPECLRALEFQLSHSLMQYAGKTLLPLVGTHLKYPFNKIKY